MRNALLTAVAVTCAGIIGSTSAAPMAIGNLVVVVVGDGSAALNNGSTAASLKEFTVGGVAQQTFALPTASSGANFPLTISGSGVEGFLKLSTNGQYLTLGGYGVAPGTTAIAGTTSAAVNRVVGRIDLNGTIDTSTALSNAHSGSNIRSAVSTNGTDFWTGGGGTTTSPLAAGVVYSTLGGGTLGTRINTSGNSGGTRRVVGIFNGQLYVSGASTGGANQAINSIGTGTPTVPSAEANLPGMPNSTVTVTHSTYDFWFSDADTVYLADDGSAAAGGGIQRWDFAAGTWTLSYTLLNNGSTTTGVRGLTGYVDGGGNAVLFGTTASTSANNIITLTDTGASSTSSIVATAAASTGFRGIEYLREVPEPASMSILALAGLALSARRRRD